VFFIQKLGLLGALKTKSIPASEGSFSRNINPIVRCSALAAISTLIRARIAPSEPRTATVGASAHAWATASAAHNKSARAPSAA